MALIFIDGFDHYGDDETQMLDGVYTGVGSGNTLSTTFSRTGTHSLKLSEVGNYVTRILGGGKKTVGVGFAIYFVSISGTSGNYQLAELRDIDGTRHIYLNLRATGAIDVIRGSTVLATSADGALVASAWQHVEFKATIDNTVGAYEVRVNGVTVVSGTGDTQNTANDVANIVAFSTSTASNDTYIDDLYVYDDSGTSNNDWMGDLRVRTIMPNDDTAQADWLKSTGTVGYQLIDEIPANDDTDYIYNEAFGDGGEVSEFELENLTGSIASIRGIQTYAKQRKTVAGTCDTQVSLVSGTSVSLGADRSITEEYTYWMDIHEVDPATGAPWTVEAVNDVKLRIERTA